MSDALKVNVAILPRPSVSFWYFNDYLTDIIWWCDSWWLLLFLSESANESYLGAVSKLVIMNHNIDTTWHVSPWEALFTLLGGVVQQFALHLPHSVVDLLLLELYFSQECSKFLDMKKFTNLDFSFSSPIYWLCELANLFQFYLFFFTTYKMDILLSWEWNEMMHVDRIL